MQLNITRKLCLLNIIHKNAWVNSEISLDWFNNQFAPSVSKHVKERGLSEKALILLDNAPSHPDAATFIGNEKY